MTSVIADTTIIARALVIPDLIIPAPPAIQAVAIAPAAVMEEVATAVVAAAIRAFPANRMVRV
jgi:hypothetical protein